MKQRIKVKVLASGCEPTFNENGDWIDLRAAEDVQIQAPYSLALHKSRGERTRNVVNHRQLIPLGVAMQLPEGMEAIVAPRSSTHKNFNILECNSIGIIDNSYNGPSDQWFFPAYPNPAGIPSHDYYTSFEDVTQVEWQMLIYRYRPLLNRLHSDIPYPRLLISSTHLS